MNRIPPKLPGQNSESRMPHFLVSAGGCFALFSRPAYLPVLTLTSLECISAL